MEATSPITGRKAEWLNNESPLGGLNLFGWNHADVPVDTLWVSESLARYWTGEIYPVSSDGSRLSQTDVDLVRSFILSQLWRSRRGMAKKLVLCRSEGEIGELIDWVGDPRTLVGYEFRGFDSILRQCQNMSFIERALRTLENMHHETRQNRKPVETGLLGIGQQNEAIVKLRDHFVESGMTYATIDVDAPALYQWLLHKNLIVLTNRPPNEVGFDIAPGGFEVLDERRRKSLDASGIGVFVVQRFDEGLELFLKPVLSELQSRLGVNVGAVWAQDHIEKIDERIFRRIRDCQAVLLHVTNDRFNVGLEAGYALALGKPVVAFREKPKDTDPDWIKRLPFDISTLNCLEYDPAVDTDQLIARLEARLTLAIGAK